MVMKVDDDINKDDAGHDDVVRKDDKYSPHNNGDNDDGDDDIEDSGDNKVVKIYIKNYTSGGNDGDRNN